MTSAGYILSQDDDILKVGYCLPKVYLILSPCVELSTKLGQVASTKHAYWANQLKKERHFHYFYLWRARHVGVFK